MLLEEAAFQAGLMLRIIRGCPQAGFEVSAEDEENRHEGKNHARQPEIQYEHGPDDKDCVESSLEGIGHEARSQFRHLINVLFHAVELLTYRRCFVVVRGEAVPFLENYEANAQNTILNWSAIEQGPKPPEASPRH